MFTGIIEYQGQLIERIERAYGYEWIVETNMPLHDVKVGDSICANGVCLTVKALTLTPNQLWFDVGPETLRVTTLGSYALGQALHLEKALTLGAPLGGHLLQGHVDGIGQIKKHTPQDGALYLHIELPSLLMASCIHKGSIALDGISLTVNAIQGNVIEVCLIPHTLLKTHLAQKEAGSFVNVETDMMGKYIVQYLQRLHHANQ